jgi:pimeloyl-ACP methyl ester carboxylesterase
VKGGATSAPPRSKLARRFWRVVGVLVLLTAPGVIYEQLAESKDLERYPPPGRLYEVRDHRLHLTCSGEGSPTVILEAGGSSDARSYAGVLPLLAKRTRVCAYDRAGMGFSESSGRALTAGELAADLGGLLKAADLHPPLVLVGASIGGLTVELYAREHPADVVGLVFLDAVDSQSLEVVGSEVAAMRFRTCGAAYLARLGLMRLYDPLKLVGEAAALAYRPAPLAAACSALKALPESDRELAKAPPLKADLPLLVLSHEVPSDLLPVSEPERVRAFEPEWQKLQQAQAKRSTRGEQWTVAQSGPLIARDRPAAVAQAIIELLDRL